MRLLLLSLLGALGAQSHSIGYRNNLLAYAPARGEFPVQSELAQGYLRYLDNTGAERLVAFNYPEPLYGIRSEQVNPLLRSSSDNKLEQQQHLALFRAWCEQRYNALRLELERLRAEGKQPSANILAQFEPLEQLIKTNAFEAVPGLSPEVQRARDEHLRIWNEARLQVLQAEIAQKGQQLQSIQPEAIPYKSIPAKISEPVASSWQQQEKQQFNQPEAIPYKSIPAKIPEPVAPSWQQQEKQQFNQPEAIPYKSIPAKIPEPIAPTWQKEDKLQLKQITAPIAAPTVPLEAPQPVQETAEVMRAREEHLKRYNEALQAQTQTQQQPTPVQPQPIENIPSINTRIAIPETPQHVEETPEVKRAREEHLKQYNEALQRQTAEAQPQPLAPLPTPAIKTTSYAPAPEPIAPLPVATIKSSIPQTPIYTSQPATGSIIRDQKIELLNKAKLTAEDKVADIADKIRIEEREQAAERRREMELRREEQQQAELEQQREQLRLSEEQRLLAAESIALQLQEQQRLAAERIAEQQELQQLKEIYANEPSSSYKLTPAKPQSPAPAQPQPQSISQQQQVQNGFFLRIQSNQPSSAVAIPEGYLLAEQTQNPFLLRYVQQPQAQPQVTQLKVSAPSASSTSFTSSAATDNSLEQATREHFKAHELALEQLRLANLKNPTNLIPCQTTH